MKMSTVEFYQENGYWKDCEPRLREALSELMSIVEIHQDCTKNNFAWAELEFAKEAIGATNETK